MNIYRQRVCKVIASRKMSAKDNTAIVIDDYKYSTRSRDSLPKTHFMKAFFENIDLNCLDEIIESMREYIPCLSKIHSDVNNRFPEYPYWNNSYIPPLDAITIYAFLAKFNPRYYVECGSGNTTKFAARSIRDNKLRTKIISIDPHPRTVIDPFCSHIFRTRLENMNLNFLVI